MQQRREDRLRGLVVMVAILLSTVTAGAVAVLAPVGPTPSAGPGSTRARPPGGPGGPTPPGPTASVTVGPRGPDAAGTVEPRTTGTVVPVPPITPGGPVRAASSEIRAAADAFLADARVVGHRAGVSVWMEGQDEVLAVDADATLQPASVQKLVTAMAVLDRLPPDFAFETSLEGRPGREPGVLAGDLVLAAGGDPTLALLGPHSLDALAARLAAGGIRRVEGHLVVDVSRWSGEWRAPGWLDWQQPRFVGWQSALLADGNRWQAGPAAVALENGRWFAGALARHGVVLTDPAVEVTAVASTSAATTLAVVRSEGRDALVQRMLGDSDNQIAESFLRELGYRHTGLGSFASGAAAVEAVAGDLIADDLIADDLIADWAPASGQPASVRPPAVDDGSGLSRLDAGTAAGWSALLLAARERAWWPVLAGGLPVAGTSGTLVGRFGGTALAGDLRAKTGTTVPTRSLAGYFTTRSGEVAVFSAIVNGSDTEAPIDAERAIDELVVRLAAAL